MWKWQTERDKKNEETIQEDKVRRVKDMTRLSPFQEQLTKVATRWADDKVMRQVVTEPGTRVREVWNGG